VEGLTIAVAYDEAFNCYFADGLELLELHGAKVRDFSPLRDERLPPDCQLIYFGCGHPERFAGELASNHCMTLALQRHFCRGQRIYAEGSGAAYLCRHMALPDGQRVRTVGLLPAIAWLNETPQPMQPVEMTLARNNWLGDGTRQVRGYLNSRWVLQRAGELSTCVEQPQYRDVVVGRHRTIGSRLHLNPAAEPNIIRSFLRPCACSLVTA
jgi:cobyrinic acid a,c-diamide synthase